MLAGICLMYGSVHAQTTNLLFDRKSDFGISAGLVGSGEVNMDFDPYVTKKNASFFIKGFYDSYMIPKLSTGLYIQIIPATVNLHDT